MRPPLHHLIALLAVALLVAMLPGCASSRCPDDGRSLSIAYVGNLAGTTFGEQRMTLASDHGIDRVAVLSSQGDPGLKFTTPEVMCALYERLEELGMRDRLRPGALRSGPGFEIRSSDGTSHFTQGAAATREDMVAFSQMVVSFIELYNQVLSLRAVDEQRALEALESTRRAAAGRP